MCSQKQDSDEIALLLKALRRLLKKDKVDLGYTFRQMEDVTTIPKSTLEWTINDASKKKAGDEEPVPRHKARMSNKNLTKVEKTECLSEETRNCARAIRKLTTKTP